MSKSELQRQINVLRDQVRILTSTKSTTFDDVKAIERNCETYGHVWGERLGSYSAPYHVCKYCDTTEVLD